MNTVVRPATRRPTASASATVASVPVTASPLGLLGVFGCDQVGGTDGDAEGLATG